MAGAISCKTIMLISFLQISVPFRISKVRLVCRPLVIAIGLILLFNGYAYTQDLKNGFFDHGVACPVSNHRGAVATIDGKGREVMLAWLYDHRGGYGLLMIDAETGKAKQFDLPFPIGDAPYASILSSKNRFYAFFNNYFVEFDPLKEAFTFHQKAFPLTAMAFTEDDKGLIWAASYPNSGLVSFNPLTKEFNDYGSLNKENWKQYPKYLATDDAGWVYVAIGNTSSQILAIDPATSSPVALLEESERQRGGSFLYRHVNGKVYGNSLKDRKDGWYELYKGEKKLVGMHSDLQPKSFIAGHHEFFHGNFPTGSKAVKLDMVEKRMEMKYSNGKAGIVSFTYTSEGAHVMGVGTSPDGRITGGTAFPMRQFLFDPAKKLLTNVPAFGQLNAIESMGSDLYFGSYPQGALLKWQPGKKGKGSPGKMDTLPAFLASSKIYTHRPHRILALADKRTVIMSGTPEYGYTGGGLLFWDNKTKKSEILSDSQVVADQSTMSMVALPEGKLLGGTTTQPGTGGEKKARQAELYLMDLKTRKVEWHGPFLQGFQDYSDLFYAPNKMVYGISNLREYFVFDPVKKKIIHRENLEKKFGRTSWAQSPRIFVEGEKGDLYILFVKGIVKVDLATHQPEMIAESPVPVDIGGDYHDGKIYFASGSHLCSYTLK